MWRLWLLTATVGLSVGVNAQAQQGGGFGGSSGGSGGGFGGSSGGSGGFGGGTGGFSSGGSGGLTGSGSSGFAGGGNSLFGGSSGATRTGAGGRSSSATAVSSTNFLAASYGNPLYPGRPGSTNLNISAGGGFGQPTLPNTTTANRTTTGGATAGTGGRLRGTASVSGGTGAGAGTQNPASRIQHTTTLDFPVRPIEYNELRAELRQMLDRTSSLRDPGRILVSVEGNTVVLTGTVSDDKERRLVEGMVRLTPGVYSVKNELQAP